MFTWLSFYVNALDIERKAFGEDDLSTASSYSGLGQVYQHRMRYNQAVEQYLKALKIWQQQLDQEHPFTLTTINNLRNCFPHIDHGDQDFDTWLSQQ